MYKPDLTLLEEQPGTVKAYDRHLFVATPDSEWPARIEAGSDAAGTIARLVENSSRSGTRPRIKVTAYQESELGRDTQVFCFPERRSYTLKEKQLEGWLESYIEDKREISSFSSVKLSGSQIFVCNHGSRDERCGQCAPGLISAIEEFLADNPRTVNANVYGCSHVGGHKYAGNILIYPSGDWYGCLDSAAAIEVFNRHFLEDAIVWKYWRGRMGLSPEEQRELAREGKASEGGS